MSSFHSPLNSNAILTLFVPENGENTFQFNSDPIINAHLQQFELLPSRANQFKLKFISKELAMDVQEKLESAYDSITTDLSYDQLTHPGNIYVRGLTQELDNQDLFELFKPFGEISSCKIVLDQFGQSKGYGFVNFINGQSAQEAIEKLNGLLINGSKLYLNHHISKKERIERIDFERLNFTNLYIKNLPIDYSEDDMVKLFVKFGEIDSIFLPELTSNDKKDLDKRFGFVNYKNHESAVEAILNLDSKELKKDLFLSVSRAQRRDERKTSNVNIPHDLLQSQLSPLPILLPNPSAVQQQSQQSQQQQQLTSPSALPQILQQTQGTPFYPVPGPNQQQSNLYVKNLSNNVTDEILYDTFAKFGHIISAKIMTLEDGITPRGFGFVCFKTIQEASNAMYQMNGNELDGEVLSVSFAQRNNKRLNHKQNSIRGFGLPQTNGFQHQQSAFLKSPPASAGSTPGSMPVPLPNGLPNGLANGLPSNGIPGYYYSNVHVPILQQNDYYYNGYIPRYRNGSTNGVRYNNHHNNHINGHGHPNGGSNGATTNGKVQQSRDVEAGVEEALEEAVLEAEVAAEVEAELEAEAEQEIEEELDAEIEEQIERDVEKEAEDLYIKLSSDISNLETEELKLTKILDELILSKIEDDKKINDKSFNLSLLKKKINDDYEGNHLDFINDLSNDDALLNSIIEEFEVKK